MNTASQRNNQPTASTLLVAAFKIVAASALAHKLGVLAEAIAGSVEQRRGD